MQSIEVIPDDLINTTRAGTIAKVHPSGVRRWVLEGRLRGWNRGGRLFVSEAEVRGLFVRVKSRGERKHERICVRQSRTEFDLQCDQILRRAGLLT